MARKPEHIKKYDPYLNPLPLPTFQPDEGDIVCVQLNKEWLSYVIGGLWGLTYPDKWQGNNTQQIEAAGMARNLIALFQLAAVCEDGMIIRQKPDEPCIIQTSSNGGETWADTIDMSLCEHEVCLPQFRFVGTVLQIDADCDDVYELSQDLRGLPGLDGEDGASPEMRVFEGYIQWRQDDDSPTWGNLIAIEDLRGLPGLDGEDGLPGLDGADGADGVCVCPDTPPDVQKDLLDFEKQACAMAKGLAKWLIDKNVASIHVIKAAATFGKALADQATDLLDAIPIFGALVNNIIDFAASMATKGDYDDIIGQISAPEFEDWLTCKLYCQLKQSEGTTVTVSSLCGMLSSVADAAAVLPPALPLITFYGQAFALWLTSVSCEQAYKRMLLFRDERSDDCLLLCLECPDVTVSFEDASSVANEGDMHIVNVRLSVSGGGTPDEIIVPIAVTGGSAISGGVDYTLLTSQVVFPAGSENGAIREVSIDITTDGLQEGLETIILGFGSITGTAGVGAVASHTVTIPAQGTWVHQFDFRAESFAEYFHPVYEGGNSQGSTWHAGLGWRNDSQNQCAVEIHLQPGWEVTDMIWYAQQIATNYVIGFSATDNHMGAWDWKTGLDNGKSAADYGYSQIFPTPSRLGMKRGQGAYCQICELRGVGVNPFV